MNQIPAQAGPPNILIVDDQPSMVEVLEINLAKRGAVVETASSGDEAIDKIRSKNASYAVIFTDLSMPGDSDGMDVLRATRESLPATQVVLMTAYASPENALQAIREGAYDYLIKPFKMDQVGLVYDRALEKHQLVAENLFFKQALEERDKTYDIVGKSEPMKKVFELIRRVARTRTTVLIEGESGTGKELVARAIHDQSAEASGPFVPINCGAIPENLIDAELFGHAKGAFTGAVSSSEGLIASANGGTVFFDEIGELPLDSQVRLLRVLQEKKVRPVGESRERNIDARILAATNRDLREEVAEGRFREDLYYRLNVIHLQLPPLRERQGDLRLLLDHYLRHFTAEMDSPVQGVSAEVRRLLASYSFPGNVRELQNIVERAVTLETEDFITVDVLPDYLKKSVQEAPDITVTEEGLDLDAALEGLERRLILEALELTGGNRTRAAELLNVSFRSLRYRLKKLELADE